MIKIVVAIAITCFRNRTPVYAGNKISNIFKATAIVKYIFDKFSFLFLIHVPAVVDSTMIQTLAGTIVVEMVFITNLKMGIMCSCSLIR